MFKKILAVLALTSSLVFAQVGQQRAGVDALSSTYVDTINTIQDTLTQHNTRINQKLTVTTTTPAVDDVIKYIGSGWVNAPSLAVSGGSGITYYMDDSELVGSGVNNDYEINELLRSPGGGPLDADTISCDSDTAYIEAYKYNQALGGTEINGGEWDFATYCAVTSTLGGRLSSITRVIYIIEGYGGSVTTTGSGISRTATISGKAAAPFSVNDSSATLTRSSHLETPQGLYRITGFTNDSTVTIVTPSTYTNESGVGYDVWHREFEINTGAILNLSPNYSYIVTPSTQQSITITDSARLGEIPFGISNNTTNVIFTHNGTEHYTNFKTPQITRHNELVGLQGGTANQYYHNTEEGNRFVVSFGGYTIPTTNGSFSGKIDTLTVGENVFAGEVLYKKSDGKYWKCDADTNIQMLAEAMAVATILADASGLCIREGYVHRDAWTWSVGNGIANVLFVDDGTAGAIVQEANKPSDSRDILQAIGWVYDDDTVYFKPDLTWVQIQ
jgi:hypothetical protein